MKKSILIIASIAILVMAMIYILETLIYRSTFDYKNQTENDYSRYSSFTYTANGKKVDVLYGNQGDNEVFVYFHGNIGRLNYILDYLNDHTTFIAPAYPGYHRSEGKPSVANTLTAISKLAPQIYEKFGKDIRLHIIGHSLGTQVASYFAHLLKDDLHLQTLTLVAGFPSVHSQCANTLGAFSLLCFPADNYFSASDYLQEIGSIRVTVYHLPEDQVIPYRSGRELFESIPLPEGQGPGKKFFYDLAQGTHGNFNIERVVNNVLKP